MGRYVAREDEAVPVPVPVPVAGEVEPTGRGATCPPAGERSVDICDDWVEVQNEAENGRLSME